MSSENPDADETMSQDPEHITLGPSEERTAKARCTMRQNRIKQEQESEDEVDEVQRALAGVEHKNIYMMEITNNADDPEGTVKLQPMSEEIGIKIHFFITDGEITQNK